MTEPELSQQIKAVEDGLTALFVGKDKRLSITAACSVAATTAHMIGMSKLELQKILIRCYDRRVANEGQV